MAGSNWRRPNQPCVQRAPRSDFEGQSGPPFSPMTPCGPAQDCSRRYPLRDADQRRHARKPRRWAGVPFSTTTSLRSSTGTRGDPGLRHRSWPVGRTYYVRTSACLPGAESSSSSSAAGPIIRSAGRSSSMFLVYAAVDGSRQIGVAKDITLRRSTRRSASPSACRLRTLASERSRRRRLPQRLLPPRPKNVTAAISSTDQLL